jgi:hypothetical protein
LDILESHTHSFIVKIWLEETAEEAGRATWRGHITHVPGGERRYIGDLDDIPAFVAPYLEGMGVRFRTWRRVGRWLRRFKLYLDGRSWSGSRGGG